MTPKETKPENVDALLAAENDSVTLVEETIYIDADDDEDDPYDYHFPEIEETEPDVIYDLQCEINSIRRDQAKHVAGVDPDIHSDYWWPVRPY